MTRRLAIPLQEIVLDHLAFIRDRRYRRLTLGRLRRFAAQQPAPIGVLTVEHEHDDSCCRIEPWPVTSRRLMQALEDDGLPSVAVDLETDS